MSYACRLEFAPGFLLGLGIIIMKSIILAGLFLGSPRVVRLVPKNSGAKSAPNFPTLTGFIRLIALLLIVCRVWDSRRLFFYQKVGVKIKLEFLDCEKFARKNWKTFWKNFKIVSSIFLDLRSARRFFGILPAIILRFVP